MDGHQLIANKSAWGQFPKLWNGTWSVANRVLIGDALHTAHFSIGSGTKLAMEDAIALADSFMVVEDLEGALSRYQELRKDAADRLQRTAITSLSWFENIDRYVYATPLKCPETITSIKSCCHVTRYT